MPPLPVVKQIEVRRALERAGFRVEYFSGSHARMVKGNRAITVPIHKGKDMARGTLRSILEQAGMSEEDFIRWLKDQEQPMDRYAVMLTPDIEDGGYTVTVPALPGVVTHGDSIEEALEMARDAIAVHLMLPEGAAAIEEDRVETIMATVAVAVPAKQPVGIN